MDAPQPVDHTAQFPIARSYQPPTVDERCSFFSMHLVLIPTGMMIELSKPDLLMGRHTAADIRLPLADVSRRHCRFLFAEGRWKIIDLDSLNGVYVNDKLVKETVLQHGDRIRIGSFLFEVRLPAAPTKLGQRDDLRRAS